MILGPGVAAFCWVYKRRHTGFTLTTQSSFLYPWPEWDVGFTDPARPMASPLLSQQLNQICREMTDLLKQSAQCRMPMSKFIPSYHHFFGRQCRVADYGYSRLKDLFEAIPHVVQVIFGVQILRNKLSIKSLTKWFLWRGLGRHFFRDFIKYQNWYCTGNILGTDSEKGEGQYRLACCLFLLFINKMYNMKWKKVKLI